MLCSTAHLERWMHRRDEQRKQAAVLGGFRRNLMGFQRGQGLPLRDNRRIAIRANPIATMSSPRVFGLWRRGPGGAASGRAPLLSRTQAVDVILQRETGMRDAARLPHPCPSIGALPALQLIVSTRNSRPSFSLSLFLKVSRHVPPPTASAPISFAALPPDNPPTHDCLGATRDDEPSFLPRVAFADNGRLAVLTRRARQGPSAGGLGSNGASLQAPAPCARPQDGAAWCRAGKLDEVFVLHRRHAIAVVDFGPSSHPAPL